MVHKTVRPGYITAMERLFSCGNATEPSGEEVAHERAVLMMVQREMMEADEANLLEEEDMHVFGQEPLSDPLTVVSCNYCKKPIKSSQYMAHAERCRSFSISDEAMELDSGTGPRRPPRKARKRIISSHESRVHSESMKRSVVTRPQSDVRVRECKEEHAEHLKQRWRQQEETVIPPPLATKIYRFRHQQQMRSVISYFFHEAIERTTSGVNPHSPMGQQVLQTGFANHMTDDTVHDLQQRHQTTVNEDLH